MDGPYRGEIADKPEVTRNLTRLMMENPSARVLVSVSGDEITGLFAFMVLPHYYTGEPTAGELMWYVKPEHRVMKSFPGPGLALLHEAERMAKEAGATKIHLTAPTEEMGKFYERCGYRQLEVTYQKAL